MVDAMLLSLLLSATTSTVAGVAVEDRVESYAISGTSARELRQQMALVGPLEGGGGRRFNADTKWQVAWSYRLSGGAGGCRVGNFDVSDTTVVTLPRWENADGADSALRSKWEVFMARLREHEAGHRQNGLLAAQAVREVFSVAAPQPNCDILDQQLAAAVRQAVDVYNQADRDYDARTNHGANQGVVLD